MFNIKMETRINPQQVSHIQIYDECKGVRYQYQTIEYVWMEEDSFLFLWFYKVLNYPAGFYRDCKRRYISNDTPLELEHWHFVRDNYVWSKPKVEIFVGEKRIKTEYFESLEQAKEYCDTNFKEVNVQRVEV
jgi:hypothetical protein